MKSAKVIVMIILLVSLSLGVIAQSQQGNKPKDNDKEAASRIFGLDKIISVHITMTQEAWDAVQPPENTGRGPMRGPMGPRPGATSFGNNATGNRPENARGGFGIQFEYVSGDIEIDGLAFKNAGVRFKGNSTFMASRNSQKKPFKFDFDRYVKKGVFLGQTTINFSNNAMDPSQIREALAYDILRLSGLPVAQTGFVKMYLTVPGKYERQYLGLYTSVQQVDEKFLQAHFGNSNGLLVKPERVQGLQYLGEDWAAYEERFEPKSGHKGKDGEKAKQRLIEFARFVNQSTDDEFKVRIASYLDIDAFLLFLAGNAILSNLDSFLGLGHNYYLYLNSTTNKFNFICWDLNMAFGGFPMGGSAEQQADLSIIHPHAGDNKLIDRLLAIDEYRTAYLAEVKRMMSVAMIPDAINAKVTDLENLTAIAIKEEPAESKLTGPMMRPMNAGNGGPPPEAMSRMMRSTPQLRDFIAKRIDSVNAQLSGKRTGFVPQNRGFGGMMNPIMFIAPQLLAAMDKDLNRNVTEREFLNSAKAFFDNADKGKKGHLTLDEVVTELNRIMPAPPMPPGMGPGGMMPPPPQGMAPPAPPTATNNGQEIIMPIRRLENRPGFRLGPIIAPQLIKTSDANQDGRISRNEWESASKRLFAESDTDKNGALNEQELNAGMGKFMPLPGGPMAVPSASPSAPKKDGAK